MSNGATPYHTINFWVVVGAGAGTILIWSWCGVLKEFENQDGVGVKHQHQSAMVRGVLQYMVLVFYTNTIWIFIKKSLK